MVWSLSLTGLINKAKELYYGPPPPPPYVCDKGDFLCEWTKGENNLRDLPTNIKNIPFSRSFLEPFSVAAILAGASVVGVPPLVAKGIYWTYRLWGAGSDAQMSAEAGWLSMNYLTANVVGHCSACPNLAYLAACAIDFSYKYNVHPEQCPAALADMVVGYVAYEIGDRIVRFCFAEDPKQKDKAQAAHPGNANPAR